LSTSRWMIEERGWRSFSQGHIFHVVKKEDPVAFAELKALIKEVENGFVVEPVDEGP